MSGSDAGGGNFWSLAPSLCKLPPMQQARRQITVGLERMMVRAANALWPHTRRLAARPAQSAVKPAWAPAPYLGQSQRTSPPLGWPRSTDSLCPQCVNELREKVQIGRAHV